MPRFCWQIETHHNHLPCCHSYLLSVLFFHCANTVILQTCSQFILSCPTDFYSMLFWVQEQQNLKEVSASSSSTVKAPEEPEGGKPSKTQQLKKVFKEYGAVGVSFHISISLMSLGMFYVLISRYQNIRDLEQKHVKALLC